MSTNREDITELLLAWNNGNKEVLNDLMQVVYDELRRLAHFHLAKERPNHTLQTTALVNEAYLKLVDQKKVHWQNRSHFFALASKLMRRILIDYARTRQYAKRGGGISPLPLDETLVMSPTRALEMIALDDALTALSDFDERKARIIELRFFAGLSIDETSELLGVSPGTVMKDWTLAKAWLQREMDRNKSNGS
jgi:RNA polymerase sigma factor (TIGR02999 family)